MMQATQSYLIPNSQEMSFAAWSSIKQQHIESVLDNLLVSRYKAPESHPARLLEAMRYSALAGGKRIRALLCYASAELCHTAPQIADAGAAAVEMIHAYSLVHDDMPCMDDDDLRRGKPSCHKQFDDATALLVGDTLQSLAFEVLANPNLSQDATIQLRLVHTLAKASGMAGMAGGQAIDLAAVGKPLTQLELEAMHQLKTGALIQAAVILGAANGSEAQINAVSDFAHHIGLAFQVVDDILDVEADSVTLGKTAGKDAVSNKPTYVTILGLDAAKKHAQSLYQAALNAISLYGNEANRLRAIAELIMQRSF